MNFLFLTGALIGIFLLGQDIQDGKTQWIVYMDWPFSTDEAKRRQEETGSTIGMPVTKTVNLGNGVEMNFVLIPAGRFIMGTPEPLEPNWAVLSWEIKKSWFVVALGLFSVFLFLYRPGIRMLKEKARFQISLGRLFLIYLSFSVFIAGCVKCFKEKKLWSTMKAEFDQAKKRFALAAADEKPAQEVILRRPFYMGKFEVTQEEFKKIMENNPSEFIDPKNPVENVSWDMAVDFCKKVTLLSGIKVRLPTEAEWEFACTGGTVTHFSFGDADAKLGDFGWYWANSGGTTHNVGQKKPNPWGMYDMHGNVAEWCQDAFGPYSAGIKEDPVGPTKRLTRVLRGGAWVSTFFLTQSRSRNRWSAKEAFSDFGFRIVLPLAEVYKINGLAHGILGSPDHRK